jgi:hypothetical protein
MARNGNIAGGIVAVVFAIFLGHFAVRKHFALSGLDSPVTVAGGSIYGTASNPWIQKSYEAMYYAHSTRNDNIVLYGLVDSANLPAPSPLQDTGGWLITFSTQDSLGNPRANTILFCSAISDGQCTGTNLGDNFAVYLQVNNLKRLELRTPTQLYFHDTDPNCDGKTNGDSEKCDEISSVTIATVNPYPGKTVTYRCKDPKNCYVAVGKPLPLSSIVFNLSRWSK